MFSSSSSRRTIIIVLKCVLSSCQMHLSKVLKQFASLQEMFKKNEKLPKKIVFYALVVVVAVISIIIDDILLLFFLMKQTPHSRRSIPVSQHLTPPFTRLLNLKCKQVRKHTLTVINVGPLWKTTTTIMALMAQ